jgi:pSer/pThr/pTyr-binding forkhead associated (FHA) protein
MAVLVGMSEHVKGKTVEIGDEPVTIGRKADNAFALDDSTVSGHHCVVGRENGQYFVRDLGSTNGTRLNNKEAKQETLKPKDILHIGSVEFMFDASPGENITVEKAQPANVEITPGPATAPQSFENISPFGARKSESKGLWFLLMAAIGLVALAAVILFFFKLLSES